jgi:menaquinone-dependent protoporphyrinogen oxidase
MERPKGRREKLPSGRQTSFAGAGTKPNNVIVQRSDPIWILGTYDAFIIAASVHQEYHQETITNFVIAHLEVLDAKPSAFISVSLSAVLEEGGTEAQKYVDSFVSVTGWRPRMTLLLGGALRLTEYDYFQEQIVKFIVMKRGDAPSSGRDREFTDWNALAGFVDGFLGAA